MTGDPINVDAETDVSPLMLAALVNHCASAAVTAAHSVWRFPELRQMIAEASGVLDAIAHYQVMTNPNERIRGHLDEVARLGHLVSARYRRPESDPDGEEE